MGDHSSPEQLKKDIRVYLAIFGALLAGTVLTVPIVLGDGGTGNYQQQQCEKNKCKNA